MRVDGNGVQVYEGVIELLDESYILLYGNSDVLLEERSNIDVGPQCCRAK